MQGINLKTGAHSQGMDILSQAHSNQNNLSTDWYIHFPKNGKIGQKKISHYWEIDSITYFIYSGIGIASFFNTKMNDLTTNTQQRKSLF